jgi:spermidine synthase
MKDPQGQQLAMAESDFLGLNYRVLAPDGGAIAQIHRKLISYRIDISRQGLDLFLILSYVVVYILQVETDVAFYY